MVFHIPKEMTNFEEFHWNIFKKYKPLISKNCDDFRFRKIHTYVPRYIKISEGFTTKY